MYRNIKIFSLATNNYKNFCTDFLFGFNNYFLPEAGKEFIIFTDDINYHSLQKENITTSFIEHEAWPMITLKRYGHINKFKDRITEDDLCIFADIDLMPVATINSLTVNRYFGVEHPGNYYINNIQSLETNTNSTAYVNINTLPLNYKYIQGCLWGGIGKDFINMISVLQKSTEQDLMNNVIAKWHDESHLNKFCIDNIQDFKFLPSSYAYPETWSLQIPKYIIHKDKNMEEYPRFQGG
jgi:hypothetical protein